MVKRFALSRLSLATALAFSAGAAVAVPADYTTYKIRSIATQQLIDVEQS